MEHYKVSVAIGEFSVEISSHDKEWVENKIIEMGIKKMISEPPRITATPAIKNAPFKVETPEYHSSTSVIEFYKNTIKEKKVTSRPDIVTFFVYYFEKIKKQDQVTSADIKNSFKQIGYPNWNGINIADSLYKAKKKAFLNNVNDLWSLTITGEDFVLNTISE